MLIFQHGVQTESHRKILSKTASVLPTWAVKYFCLLPTIGITLSIPAFVIFSFAYGIVNAILDSSINNRYDLRELEQAIKEKKAYLDGELSKFKELEKKYAKYWLNLSGYQFEKRSGKAV